MRLRKPCEHGRYEEHSMLTYQNQVYGGCPGGEFLADDALIIERMEGRWALPGEVWVTFRRMTGLSTTEITKLLDTVGEAYDVWAAAE